MSGGGGFICVVAVKRDLGKNNGDLLQQLPRCIVIFTFYPRAALLS